MFKIKILKVLMITVTFTCFLFAFSFLVACRDTIPVEETELIGKALEDELVEEEIGEILDEEVEQPEQVTTDEPLSSCSNSYFPVKENTFWNYELQATGIESFNYSLSFKDITGNSFTQVVALPDATIESKWNCSELGILQTEYRELSFADSTLGQIEYETIGVEGINFPPENELAIGKTWDVIYDTKAKIKAGDIETDATVIIETEFEIISIEDVEVPAGSYSDAFNIENKVTISISSDFLNTTFTSDSNSWFARDVGLVKNVGNMDETQTITELLSVN